MDPSENPITGTLPEGCCDTAKGHSERIVSETLKIQPKAQRQAAQAHRHRA
ncbi:MULTISPECIES: hypothetical protein [unclassified Mesorhizobium]|uniref:hypothetical protein n=1 Tax=unclassified Mesorhizobium TaxID=325217 RepID=UPI0012DD3140|nr:MULTISPECIES: hypothetical protein [unclassified Mesorhizobium]WJI42881.1 hypothetical protein NL532_19625 [Mesorhizobium sp. C120A]